MAAHGGAPNVRILLADPSPGYREALARLLKDHPVEIVGEARDTVELSLAVERLRPDVVLLDPELPGVQGRQAIQKLEGVSPESAVILLSLVGGGPPRSPQVKRPPGAGKEVADRRLMKKVVKAARNRRSR